MLEGLRVIDLGDESAWLAGKILGDLGADVLKVEPPGGDRCGRRAPFLGGIVDPERSLAWLALNTSKRGITLDATRPAGRGLLARLLEGADVLLESCSPAQRTALGLHPEALRHDHPRLVHCAMTPFGLSGPYAGYRGGDLVVVAMGGNAALTGEPDRPPVRCTMPTAYYHAAPEAVFGVLTALAAREAGGTGQLVDVSLHECQLQTLLGTAATAALGTPALRRAGARIGRTREIWAACDGWISFGLRGGPSRAPGLRALVEWMAETGEAPDWLCTTDWDAFRPDRLDGDALARLEETFAGFFAKRSRSELYEGALARRILLAPCNDPAAVLAQPQLRARDLFATIDYPALGTSIEHPAFFARASADRVGIRRRAPRIGEHNDDVYGALGIDAPARAGLAAEGVI